MARMAGVNNAAIGKSNWDVVGGQLEVDERSINGGKGQCCPCWR
jgi:hypothetical protein